MNFKFYIIFLVISDFEKAIVRGAENVFPNIRSSGCFFHLSQTMFKKMKKLKLDELYGQQNNDEALAVRMTFRFVDFS